ncbi:MAG: serine hydrolase [Acidobacteria bacterium]|nr:serine hydrolase [Acidobacteriota bacterium]
MLRSSLRALALAFLGLPVFAQAPAQPTLLGDGWERVEPQAAGFDAAQLRAVIARMLDGEVNLHGVVVERHGKLVAEAYRKGKDQPQFKLFSRTVAFGPSVRHDTRSVGKSVIGLLVGIAQAQGKLGALTTPVIDFYPEFKDLATPELKRVTLEHLLTMSSGLTWRESGVGFPNDEDRLSWKDSPMRFVLSRPFVAQSGSTFTYNSGGTVVLADILSRVTGQPWMDFARTALFEPLGITDVEWITDFRGRPMANSGLRLRPRDMAKLGRLVLSHGAWKDRQLVPAAWIDASLRPRLSTGFDGTRYGYQWWTGTVNWKGRPLPWRAAFGNGSQRIFVVPDLDLTVVTTAGAYGDVATIRKVHAGFQELIATVVEGPPPGGTEGTQPFR